MEKAGGGCTAVGGRMNLQEAGGGWTEVGRRLVKAGGRWRRLVKAGGRWRLEGSWRRLEDAGRLEVAGGGWRKAGGRLEEAGRSGGGCRRLGQAGGGWMQAGVGWKGSKARKIRVQRGPQVHGPRLEMVGRGGWFPLKKIQSRSGRPG